MLLTACKFRLLNGLMQAALEDLDTHGFLLPQKDRSLCVSSLTAVALRQLGGQSVSSVELLVALGLYILKT